MAADQPLLKASAAREFLTRHGFSSMAEVPFHDRKKLANLNSDSLELDRVMPYRRLHNVGITLDSDAPEHLLAQGIHSAQQIAAMSRERFVRLCTEQTGMTQEEAERAHRRAVRIQTKSLHLLATVHGIVSPYFRGTRVASVGNELPDHFQDVPGYQEMFGSLDYCGCAECKSIFGPAAYFVDLMRLIDERITKVNPDIPAPFLLNSRRPDLAQMPLTCEVTNQTVPYLRIVNERLFAAARSLLQIPDDETLLRQMAGSMTYPHNLPFVYPLDQIRLLLKQARISLSDLFAAWGRTSPEVMREALGLSLEQVRILTTPETNPDRLAGYYFQQGKASDLDSLADLATFVRQTGLKVSDATDLITQGLTADQIKAGVPKQLFINQGLGNNFLTLSDDAAGNTRIGNLTPGALDNINRLLRLSAATGWSPAVTDWVLCAVAAGSAPAIDQTALERIQRVHRLAKRFALTPLQTAALFGPIKTYGDDGAGGPAPFDQLFNSPEMVARFGPYTTANWQPDNPATQPAALRVAPGLGLSLDDMTSLAVFLFGDSPTVVLNLENLSALYRHALLSRCLNLPVEQYAILLGLFGAAGKKVFQGADLDHLLLVCQWAADAGLNAYQLQYVQNGVGSVYVNPLLDETKITPWLAGLIMAVPGDPKSPDAAAAVASAASDLLGLERTLTEQALALGTALVPLPTGLSMWTEAFLAPGNPPPYQEYVTAVLRRVARTAVFAQAAGVPAEVVKSMSRNLNAFGLKTGDSGFSGDTLRDASLVATLIRQYSDQRGNLVQFIDFSGQIPVPEKALEALQAATGWDAAAVAQLLGSELKGVTRAGEQLRRLAVCFDQMRALGGDVAFVRGVAAIAAYSAATETDWTAYKTQADRVLAKVSARFGADRWAQMHTQVEGELGEGLRDALAGVVLAVLGRQYKDIRTPNNVYEFLLIDVETGPEAQISYVKEGLNAVQLYLQRCRMQLEPYVTTIDIPPVWWDWILNYREWEANRRVFLYPENYLIPAVRRDKTSLFKKLENDLLQSKLTPEYIESAYGAYVEDLLNLANLRPVDAWRGEVVDPRYGPIDSLYLFARSDTTPYTFYMCRKLKNKPWSEWEKIDLDIGSSLITAVYAFNRMFLFWAKLETISSPTMQISTQGGQATTNVLYRADILYSFQDRTGKWVQPQTLADNLVVDLDGQGPDAVPLKDNDLFSNVFDMQQQVWQKVFALHVSADKLAKGMEANPDSQHILVLYGPMLTNKGGSVATGSTAPSQNPDAAAFTAMLIDRAEDHNRALTDRATGRIPFLRAWVLDSALRSSAITTLSETFLLDPYLPGEPQALFRPLMNDLQGSVQIELSSTPILDTYLNDAPASTDIEAEVHQVSAAIFVTEAINKDLAQAVFGTLVAAGVIKNNLVNLQALAGTNLYTAFKPLLDAGTLQPLQLSSIQQALFQNAGAPVLFGAADYNRARVAAVKNQPGCFLFDNGDEAFLIVPKPEQEGGDPEDSAGFTDLAGGLRVAPPPFHPGSFKMSAPSVSYEASAMVFETLQSFTVLDKDGLVNTAYCQPSGDPAHDTLTTILTPLVAAHIIPMEAIEPIRHILLNYPLIEPNAFTPIGLTAKESATVHQALSEFRLFDPNGRLDWQLFSGRVLSLTLGPLVMAGFLQPKQITGIYRTLVEAAIPIALAYINQNQTIGGDFLASGKFNVVRLTTAAVPRLDRALFVGGLDRLLSLESQNIPIQPILPFDRLKPAANRIVGPDAIDGVQVDFDGLYGQYFWELFFHTPMLVANNLASNQSFREALSWFRYVFDPTTPPHPVTDSTFSSETAGIAGLAIDSKLSCEILDQLKSHTIGTPAAPIVSKEGMVNPQFAASTPLDFLLKVLPVMQPEQAPLVRNVLLNYQLATPSSRYWQFRKFRTHTFQSLQEMLKDSNPAMQAYNDNPFDPFAIARLRTGAFEKATVMQYIDTLINWGDYYFALDTWESITAATMLYTYASDMLGKRPEQTGVCASRPAATFADIKRRYPDGIPQFLLYLEGTLPSASVDDADPVAIQQHGFNDLGGYFCIPENDAFITYWDRVEDRLNKIRHSMNIKGQFRSLALFEPPLDPMALVRAAAASNDVLRPAGGKAEIPPFRFRRVLERARSLVATVSELGQQLLVTLEKRDAEALVLLRNTQESQILSLLTQVKEQQVLDLKSTITSLQDAMAGAQARLDHYSDLLNKGISSSEERHLDAMAIAAYFRASAGVLNTASAIGYAVPQVGSPFAITYGGQQMGHNIQASAGAAEVLATIAQFAGDRALTMAGYQRRENDWELQKTVAQHDVDNLRDSIAAAQARLTGAQRDLEAHVKTIAQNQQLDEFLHGKFTSQDLYQWMAGRLSALCYQTYLVAVGAVASTEAALQYELRSVMKGNQTFLTFDYWDSLHKGLMAGEGLRLALDRMDEAYANTFRRSLEIERTISLAEIDPEALTALKQTGTCEFELLEALFDYDFPGHYGRRIKSIAISLPAVVGPYQNVRATLTQKGNAVVLEPSVEGVRFLLGKTAKQPPEVLVDNKGTGQIAVSRGVDDTGLFVLDFNDERFLPFEGSGAVSKWSLELPAETNRFDVSQLPDVIISLRYTAQFDGSLKSAVEAELANTPLTTGYYLDTARYYPTDWQALMQNHSNPDHQTLTFMFRPSWPGKLKELTLDTLFLRFAADLSITWPASLAMGMLTIGTEQPVAVSLVNGTANLRDLDLKEPRFSSQWQLTLDLKTIGQSVPGLLKDGWIDPAKLLNVEWVLVCQVQIF